MKAIKNNIFGFIVGAVIFGCLGVIAANMVNARDILYRDTNVESAIDDLYTKANHELLRELTLKIRTQNNGASYMSNTNYMMFDNKIMQYYDYFMITNVSCSNVDSSKGGGLTYGDNHGSYEVLSANTKYSFEVYTNIWTNVISTSNDLASYCDVTIKFYNE